MGLEQIKELEEKGFRLLTELYSFLREYGTVLYNGFTLEFPSPYGVIFILTVR